MRKLFFLSFILLFVNAKASNNRYRLIITDNPSTSIMIGWDQVSGSNPKVYYDTSDYGRKWKKYSYSKSVTRTVVYKGMTNTFAKLSGLSPNTNYYFVIKDSDGTSKRFWFKTAPSKNKSMSFISGGDSRNNRKPRRNANRLVAKLKPTAVFFGGDMTNDDSSSEWKNWFSDWQLTIASDGRMFPIVPARGNHEESNKSIYNLFNVPSEKVYYDITFGENLYTIYTLNSEISAGGSQYKWLNNKLRSDNSIWKSAQYHKPMRPHVRAKSEGNDEYENWAQLFYDQGMDLVYESDSHGVKSTWPIKPCKGGADCDEGFVRDDDNGTIYLGEGCWGAPLRKPNDKKKWTRNTGKFNQFKWIFVKPSRIEVRTINVNNAKSVGEVSNKKPFKSPKNLKIWNPSNGKVITLRKQTATDNDCDKIRISISFDDYPEDISWEIKNNKDDIVLKGEAYDQSQKRKTLHIDECLEKGCYTFIIKDSYNDGLCCDKGNGAYRLDNMSKRVNLATMSNNFLTQESTKFCITNAVNRFSLDKVKGNFESQFFLSPNPMKNLLFIKSNKKIENKDYKVSIYNMKGQLVYSGGLTKPVINVSAFNTGIYIVKIKNLINGTASVRKMLKE